jgi:hypothetical protein
MSLFGKILKTGFDIVTAPIEVVKDAATLGGLATDQREPYTLKRLKRLADDAEEVRNEIDDL